MSDCLIDCSVSTTVAKCTSCPTNQQCAPILNALSRIPGFCSPPLHLISSNWGGGASGLLTFACASPPYGAFSKAPLNAPSESPPRNSCLIWLDNVCTSEAETEGMEGKREDMSKFAGDSGSKRSTFMVRQFIVAMIAREEGLLEGILSYGCRLWRERREWREWAVGKRRGMLWQRKRSARLHITL